MGPTDIIRSNGYYLLVPQKAQKAQKFSMRKVTRSSLQRRPFCDFCDFCETNKKILSARNSTEVSLEGHGAPADT